VELAPRVEIAIAARSEPRLPVARLRASRQLLELRTADLAFDPDETAAAIAADVPDGLSADVARTIHDRSEGWPAVVALAAPALRASPDPAAFAARFGASNRHVADYLDEQVLAPLADDDRALLRAVSILDSVCGALADALVDGEPGGPGDRAGRADGADRLAALERGNVPVLPLDERRAWYRLHPLLAERLRDELDRRSPDRVAELHRRAAAWFATAGDPERAVRHAIASGDVDLAAGVIGAAYLAMLEGGRLATVVGWLDALGPAAVESDRRLAVVRAWSMHFLGRHDEGNAALQAAMRAPSVGPMPDGSGSIEATAALLGAAFPGNDAAGMLASARRAYELEANRQSPWTVPVHILLGFGLVRMGQFAEARDHLRMGAELAITGGMWMDAVGARALLGRVALETGNADLAEDEVRTALLIGDQHGLDQTPTYAFGLALLGAILVRTDRPDEGAAMLERALPATEAIAEPLALGELLVALGQARRLQGRLDESDELLRQVDGIIERSHHPGYLRTLRRAAAPVREPPVGEALSPRELEVLRVLARGRSKRQTAEELFVAYNTVHSQVRSIYRKLDVHSSTAAIARARQRGLID